MSKLVTPLICLAALLIPCGVVFAMNYDKIVTYDKKAGTLWYFPKYT